MGDGEERRTNFHAMIMFMIMERRRETKGKFFEKNVIGRLGIRGMTVTFE